MLKTWSSSRESNPNLPLTKGLFYRYTTTAQKFVAPELYSLRRCAVPVGLSTPSDLSATSVESWSTVLESNQRFCLTRGASCHWTNRAQNLERREGIEPSPTRWQRIVLPIDECRSETFECLLQLVLIDQLLEVRKLLFRPEIYVVFDLDSIAVWLPNKQT